MYHFVDLDAAGKVRQRELLNWYAFAAQLSVLIPLLLVQIHLAVSWLAQKQQSTRGIDRPSSPWLKANGGSNVSKFSHYWTLLRWWSREPLRVFGANLGSKGSNLAMAGWGAWLVFLAMAQTGDDYLHLTRRFGLVAASQLPLHYLLAMKSPYSPILLLTRSSHETLNVVHRSLGRIITAMFWVHVALFLNLYVIKGILLAKLQAFYILCGLFSIMALTVIGTTALAAVREWNYRVFYVAHVVLATAILPALYFHVSHIRPYLYETIAVYVLNVGLRWYNSKTLPGTIKAAPGTSLVEMVFVPPSKADLNRWHVGQHAYVSLPGNALLRTFRSNPFTVASVPHVDGHIKFVARVMDGNTLKLLQAAKGASAQQRATIEGPYGLRTHAERLLQCDRVLLVAGGIGATFIVPIYRQLLADLSPSKGSPRRQKVDCVWAVRRAADVQWSLPSNANDRQGFLERLTVYISGQQGDGTQSSHDVSSTSSVPGDDGADTSEGIELEERKGLLNEEGEDEQQQQVASGELRTRGGRPDLNRILSQTFSHGSTEQVGVVVCGPGSLSSRVRNEVAKWVRQGRDVVWHEEAFHMQ